MSEVMRCAHIFQGQTLIEDKFSLSHCFYCKTLVPSKLCVTRCNIIISSSVMLLPWHILTVLSYSSILQSIFLILLGQPKNENAISLDYRYFWSAGHNLPGHTFHLMADVKWGDIQSHCPLHDSHRHLSVLLTLRRTRAESNVGWRRKHHVSTNGASSAQVSQAEPSCSWEYCIAPATLYGFSDWTGRTNLPSNSSLRNFL